LEVTVTSVCGRRLSDDTVASSSSGMPSLLPTTRWMLLWRSVRS
jgi:hypothetical protein